MMRYGIGLLCILLFPFVALASVSGIDDVNPNISDIEQASLDNAITTYYQHPTVKKVDIVLDLMAAGRLVRKKTAWPPLVGFLSIVFAEHKDHVMRWISRDDYNLYAQDILVAALMHAKLRETALLFAQASRWKEEDIDRIRHYDDTTDFKKLAVVLPGHIDTLWGAFFASGDPVYVNEIIDVLFMTKLPYSDTVIPPEENDVLSENQALARSSLALYALNNEIVRAALEKRIALARDRKERQLLKQLLPYPQ